MLVAVLSPGTFLTARSCADGSQTCLTLAAQTYAVSYFFVEKVNPGVIE